MALKKNEAAELAKAEAALDAEAKAAAVKEDPTPEPEVKEEPAPTPEPEVKEEPTPEPEVKEEPAPAPEPEVKEGPAQALVKVVNLTHSTLYQHSSGLSIGPKAEKALLNDGWLANQLKARLLKRV